MGALFSLNGALFSLNGALFSLNGAFFNLNGAFFSLNGPLAEGGTSGREKCFPYHLYPLQPAAG